MPLSSVSKKACIRLHLRTEFALRSTQQRRELRPQAGGGVVRRLALAALIALGASPALAAGATGGAFETCAAKAHGATFSLLHCYAQEMQAREDAMTTAYNAALDAADPKTKGFIERSQTAWTDYRDAWCEATVPRSGSLARLRLMRCRLDETARRTDALRALTGR
jgi:uncharacterized protein YecT (DUF1311 family)